jgi:hypothetical protein
MDSGSFVRFEDLHGGKYEDGWHPDDGGSEYL